MKLRIVCCLSLMMMVVSVAAAQCNTGRPLATAFVNWPQNQFDTCRTGYNPYEFLLSPTTVGDLTLKWTAGATPASSVTIVNGLLYLGGADGTVQALNASTGALVWEYKTGHDIYPSPTVANGIVYAPAGFSVYALDAKTGVSLWTYTTGFYTSSPTVAYGSVYVGSYDFNLYALDATTGALRWKYTTGGEVSAPAVANGAVYVGSNDHNLYAVDAITGGLRWKYTTDGRAVGSPAVAYGMVYVGANDYIYAIDANYGWLYWKSTTGNQYNSYSPATVANGFVYVGAQSPMGVYALNAFNGALVWKYDINAFYAESPVVANGVVYAAGEDDHFYALEAYTGSLLWTNQSITSPIVVNGVLYVAAYDEVSAYGLPNH